MIEPIDPFARPRPTLHGFDASTRLVDFAIVSFAVDPARLRSAIPAPLVPSIRRLDDGREVGFVSAVSFRDVDFRFAGLSGLRRSFFQTNYRAYVLDADGRRAVFFFGTTLDSRFVAVPRRLWSMPWHPGRTTLTASWVDGHCRRYSHHCAAAWGAADVELTGTGTPMGRLDGFGDVDDAAAVLTHPLDGYFTRPDGRLGRYAVWHERLRPELGQAIRADYAVFQDLGLVEPGAVPHSVLLQPAIDFDVLLPPTLA